MINQRLLRNYIFTHTPPLSGGIVASYADDIASDMSSAIMLERSSVVRQSGYVVEGGLYL